MDRVAETEERFITLSFSGLFSGLLYGPGDMVWNVSTVTLGDFLYTLYYMCLSSVQGAWQLEVIKYFMIS